MPIIRGKPGCPATDVKPILSLWRALEYPPIAGLITELLLVARAARECKAELFARDIRGENWDGAPDRSRSVATLCVQKRWTSRLDAATDWATRRGRSTQQPQKRKTAHDYYPPDAKSVLKPRI